MEVGHVAVSEEEVVAGAVHVVSHLGAEDTAASLTRRRTAILPPHPTPPMLTFRKKPEISARLMLVQLSWHPKAGGDTGSSIRCMTSNSSARMATASRKAP